MRAVASAPTAARWPLRAGHCAAPPRPQCRQRRQSTAPAPAAAMGDGGGGAAAAARRLGLMRKQDSSNGGEQAPPQQQQRAPQQQQQEQRNYQPHHHPRPWPGRGGAGGAGAGGARAARSRSRSRSRGRRPWSSAPQSQQQQQQPPIQVPASAPPKLPEAVDWDDMPTGLAVTWLGTSSGAPSLHRNISCTVLRHRPQATATTATAGAAGAAKTATATGDNSPASPPPNAFIVDAGEGSARQLARTGVDLSGARAVLLTHLHGDHCFGLGSLVGACLAARRAAAQAETAQAAAPPRPQSPLLVVGPPGVHDLVAAQLLATGLMRSLLPEEDRGDAADAEGRAKRNKRRTTTTTTTISSTDPHPPLLHVIELVELPGDAVPASPAQKWRKHAAACALAGDRASAAVLFERLSPRQGERPDAELRARLKGSSLIPPEQRRMYQQQWQQQGYNNNNHSNGHNHHHHHHNQSPAPAAPTAGLLDADTGNGARPPPYTAKPGLVWDVPVPPDCGASVQAAQLQHRVPCWGYVWEEDSPLQAGGNGRQQQQQPPLLQRRRGLLPHGADESSLYPPLGRKVVLLGDTVDSSALAPLALGADLIAHEATFARGMEGKAAIAQHSTARMAGCFARAIGARRLVLTHFSARYDQAQQQQQGPGDGQRGGRGGGRQQQQQRGGTGGGGPGGGDAAAQQEQQAEEERAQRVAIDALRLEAALAFVGAGGHDGGGFGAPPSPAEVAHALSRVDAAYDFWSAHVGWPQDSDDGDYEEDGGGAVESMR